MDTAVFELGKITDDGAHHGWLKQTHARRSTTCSDDANNQILTKKQRVQRRRRRSREEWLYLENEEIEADHFWRKRNCVGLYYSRRDRRRNQTDESYKRVTRHGTNCMAAAAAKGGLGEPVVASDLRAPHGCKPIGRLQYPVVALKEAPSGYVAIH